MTAIGPAERLTALTIQRKDELSSINWRINDYQASMDKYPRCFTAWFTKAKTPEDKEAVLKFIEDFSKDCLKAGANEKDWKAPFTPSDVKNYREASKIGIEAVKAVSNTIFERHRVRIEILKEESGFLSENPKDFRVHVSRVIETEKKGFQSLHSQLVILQQTDNLSLEEIKDKISDASKLNKSLDDLKMRVKRLADLYFLNFEWMTLHYEKSLRRIRNLGRKIKSLQGEINRDIHSISGHHDGVKAVLNRQRNLIELPDEMDDGGISEDVKVAELIGSWGIRIKEVREAPFELQSHQDFYRIGVRWDKIKDFSTKEQFIKYFLEHISKKHG